MATTPDARPVSEEQLSYIRARDLGGMGKPATQSAEDRRALLSHVDYLSARIASLEARNASLEKDAGRYRYLRREHVDFVVQQSYPKIWKACNGPDMDDAIDCAIERDVAAISAAMEPATGSGKEGG